MTETLLQHIRASVPAQLFDLPIWLLHDSTKTPIYANGHNRHGALDGVADRQQLVTLAFAANALARTRRAVGLGIALGAVPGEDITVSGIDLDHCYTGETLDPRVIEVMGAANSYAERSPSGNGVHIIGLGDIGTTRSAGLELYSGARYFTMTGNALNRADLDDLADAAALARTLYKAIKACRAVYSGNVVPISLAVAKRAGTQFEALLRTFELMQMYLGSRAGKPGWHNVICPWVNEHTGAEISGTAISEPSEANGWWGGFRCHHAHCEHRGMRDVRAWCRALVREIDKRNAN